MINQSRLVQTFCELVKIDSPSGEEQRVGEEVAKRLTALGATVEKDAYGNVIGKFSGVGEPMMLNAHLDTVEPGRGIKPVVEKDRIVSDGTTIIGGDCKAGIAIILEALTSLVEDKKKHLPLEVVFTREEEIGLFGAVNLDYTKISAKQAVTFDGEKAVNNVTTSAPGYNRFDVTITGRGAHAGSEPEKGISAIKIASEIIAKLSVGRIDHETTANIGLITGGTARNAVPENVHFKGEVRSRDMQKLEKHSLHFEEVFACVMKSYPDAKIEVNIYREFNPYVFEENHQVIQKVKETLMSLGLTPRLAAAGGGTDVNIFHTHGIEAVCVGIGDYNAHTTREYVSIQELFDGASFCEKLVTV